MTIEYKTLRILFEVPEPDAGGGSGVDGEGEFAGDWLRVEQVPYENPPASGFDSWLDSISRGIAVTTLPDLMAQYNSACDDDGCLEVEIHVHKSRADLDYTIKASYGVLSARFVSTTEHTVSKDVDFEDSIDLDVLVAGDVTAEWEGEVIGEDGSFLIVAPDISTDGSVLSFNDSFPAIAADGSTIFPAKKVAGTLRLTYTEQHDTYILTIEPRPAAEVDPDSVESAYQSTVVAVWGDGNVERLVIELPKMEGNCNGGGSVVFNPDDDGDEERCIRLIEVRDPCPPYDLISSREEQIDCPEEEESSDG